MAEANFQVIARRWRPRTFAEIVGQQHIVRTLTNALTTGRLAHAYLFVGPRGTGKTTTARILAKALCSPGGPKVDFDPEHPISLEIEQGSYLDVVEIDAASNRKLEDAHKIREACQVRPTGSTKVFIVDEAHQLTKEAFNALLKTIEEPPPWVRFIFATTEAEKVLETIVSRCQRFEFQPIPEALIAERLEAIVKADGVKAERSALLAIARLAQGGMRDSQSILDQVIAFAGKTVAEKDVLEIYGLASVRQVADLARALAAGDAAAALDLADQFHTDGRDLLRILIDLQAVVRTAVLDAVRQGGRSAQLGAELGSEALVRLLDTLQQAEPTIRQGLSPRAAFEITLLKSLEIARQRPLDALIRELSAAANGLPREPGQKKISPSLAAPEAVTRPSATVAAPVVVESGPPDEVLEQNAALTTDEAETWSESPLPETLEAGAALAAELPLPETLPSVRSGHEDFERALASIPPGVRKKLKETLGAEFTVLRPSPPAGLSRPR